MSIFPKISCHAFLVLFCLSHPVPTLVQPVIPPTIGLLKPVDGMDQPLRDVPADSEPQLTLVENRQVLHDRADMPDLTPTVAAEIQNVPLDSKVPDAVSHPRRELFTPHWFSCGAWQCYTNSLRSRAGAADSDP